MPIRLRKLRFTTAPSTKAFAVLIRKSTPFFLIILLFVLSSCDEKILSSEETTQPQPIQSLVINPSSFVFDDDVGVRDTTLQVEVEIRMNPADYTYSDNPTLQLEMRRKGSSETESTFEIQNYDETTHIFSETISITTPTTSIRDYEFSVTANQRPTSNRAFTNLSVRGFTTGEILIEFVEHPETVQIPSSGQEAFLLKAKVVQTFDQDLIDRVFVDMYDNNNVRLGNRSFILFDDGTNGDEVAGDSLFTKGFSLNENNQPDEIRLEFHARDVTGARSDTTISNMSFIR